MNSDHLSFTVNSPYVNLEIISFKGETFWKELMVEKGFKDIWGLIEYIAPVELFNIYNFHLIEKRFIKNPTRERIIRVIRELGLYCVVKLNLHDPFKGYSIRLHNSLDEAKVYTPSNPTCTKLFKGDNCFAVQDYVAPLVEKTSALVNTFVFYEVFNNYVQLANANKGSRSFVTLNNNGLSTDKIAMGIKRNINWRGIAFENSLPVRDRSRSIYFIIEDLIKHLRNDASFYDVFRKINTRINNYVAAANGDKRRICMAEGYGPLTYNESENLMKELRFRRIRLGLLKSDFDRCFTPYLEIGATTDDYILGVVSR